MLARIDLTDPMQNGRTMLSKRLVLLLLLLLGAGVFSLRSQLNSSAPVSAMGVSESGLSSRSESHLSLLPFKAEMRLRTHPNQVNVDWFLEATARYASRCGETFDNLPNHRQVIYGNYLWLRLRYALSEEALRTLGQADTRSTTQSGQRSRSELEKAVHERIVRLFPDAKVSDIEDFDSFWDPLFVAIVNDIKRSSEPELSGAMPPRAQCPQPRLPLEKLTPPHHQPPAPNKLSPTQIAQGELP